MCPFDKIYACACAHDFAAIPSLPDAASSKDWSNIVCVKAFVAVALSWCWDKVHIVDYELSLLLAIGFTALNWHARQSAGVPLVQI